jgi:hypothetical protein
MTMGLRTRCPDATIRRARLTFGAPRPALTAASHDLVAVMMMMMMMMMMDDMMYGGPQPTPG